LEAGGCWPYGAMMGIVAYGADGGC